MKVELPYGTGKIHFDIAKDRLAGIVEPNDVKCHDASRCITNAVKKPSNARPLDEFVKGAKELLVIVNDATRPTPTAKVLEVVYPVIKSVRHKFIVATGMHRAPTNDEYYQIFGKLYDDIKDNVFAHDSRDDSRLAYIGRSKNGTEMFVNKMAINADKIIVIGSVEPHYFAGYTGGRKGFLPGIAGYKTIEQNHKYALDVRAQALALDGNPVHDDMEDAIRNIGKPVFAIMTVLDKHHKIYAATAGDIHSSFYDAIESANEVFSVKIKEKADIVVTVAPYPMDIDLYQSQKALDNGKLALNDGGILILVSKCRMGIGEEGFVKLLSQASTPKEVLEKIGSGYRLGYHKAAKMAEIGIWAQMWGVTDLSPDVLKSVFIKPCKDIQSAIDGALEEKPGGKVIVLPNGSITVPRLVK